MTKLRRCQWRWVLLPGAARLLAGIALAGQAVVAQPLPSPVIDDDRQTTWRTVTWDDFRDRGNRRNADRLDVGRSRGGTRRVGAWLLSAVQIDRVEVIVEHDPKSSGWIARPATWRVYSLMDKQRSGVSGGDRSDEMLTHEQRHFDLAELCARRLRHDVGAMRTRAGSRERARKRLLRDLTDAHERLGRHFRLLQQRYDGETDHGLKLRKQRKWSRRIDRWLGQEVPSTCDG